jgi:hypothetical protein
MPGMVRRNTRAGLVASLLLLATWISASCATTANFDDTTPPTVELKYRFDDGLWEEVPAGGLTVDFDGDVLHLWAVGRDSGGVERVKIYGDGSVTCRRSTGVNYSDDIRARETHAEDPSVGDGDRTESVRNVTMTVEPCSPDTFKGGSISFYAEARNFAGATATSGVLVTSR